jgi:CheY-like chemotaxis protein
MADIPAYDLHRLKALVIEDNRNMRTIVCQVLQALGIRDFKEAEDGADAFKILKVYPADLVITDRVMTPLDGLEFTRMVRKAKDSPNPYISIIMLSAYTEARHVRQARDAGVNEFLAKPVSATALYRRVVHIIESPRPFVVSRTYTGPCRHRHADDTYGGPHRRESDCQAAADDGAAARPREDASSVSG